MSQIVLISGSPSEPSRTSSVLRWIGLHFESQGIQTHLISVRDLPAEDLLYGRTGSPIVLEANHLIASADAVVVGTPIYKAAYTGILKAYLDSLPMGIFEGKPVLPIGVGGSFAHLLALDYALKPVLNVMGARILEQGVYGLESQLPRTEAGTGYQVSDELERRLTEACDALLQHMALTREIYTP
ncbi:NADPH-dependent FMN reductase [Alicyclobacillus cycloheptanicus]|uniref:FMN reductase n=1 Tax=Alicyclobacillus cycloheptanicus TaxID=1457 RepID=A0ABT9XHJ7_9BACL|nr:NADPH-dependent FMN reductase [Alicyclobacillus cycloheptanicus]MDQ0189590.1 FMN reductase [Alicyclobacillus cycloheptanicus]WDL99901.1 NADPH-dependent FMN reductase [Alicyclobacillus cycloheptanicus]